MKVEYEFPEINEQNLSQGKTDINTENEKREENETVGILRVVAKRNKKLDGWLQ